MNGEEDTQAPQEPVEKDPRIPTHVIGLDDILEGGIPKDYILLLCGHAGTMKSTVGYSIIYNGCKKNGL